MRGLRGFGSLGHNECGSSHTAARHFHTRFALLRTQHPHATGSYQPAPPQQGSSGGVGKAGELSGCVVVHAFLVASDRDAHWSGAGGGAVAPLSLRIDENSTR